MNYYYGYNSGLAGYGILSLILHVVGIILLVWLVVWLIRGVSVGGPYHHRRHWRTDTAIHVLRERYAKGEISKEEFETRKKDLQQ